MPVYYSIGNRLLTEEMLADRKSPMVSKILSDNANRARLPDVTPPAHPKRARSGKPETLSIGADQDFERTGMGKPLAIWITSAYAGELGSTWYTGSRGVLVSSAVKAWHTVDAQPRALNVLKKEVKKNQPIGTPAAVEQGTPLVFYSPAVVDRSLVLTVEFAFDDIDEALFKTAGEVFSAAGGLPVFASATPYLLAAGALFKIGGAVANRIFDSRAEFQATEKIKLSDGAEGFAGYALLTRTPIDNKTLLQNRMLNSGHLADKDGMPYTGDIPHVVIALDGRPDRALEKFAATSVSAALLQRFYNVREDGQTDARTLIDALTLYNDFRYRKEAADLQVAINDPGTGEEEKARLQRRYDAILKNIQTELFKPKNPGGPT